MRFDDQQGFPVSVVALSTCLKRFAADVRSRTAANGDSMTFVVRRWSQWVYEKLRRFRAGIESGISLLKRVFGLARCVWKGAAGFHAYVRTAVLAANLLLLARTRIT